MSKQSSHQKIEGMNSQRKQKAKTSYSRTCIRVIIYQESSHKGRVALFDSHYSQNLDNEIEMRRKSTKTLDSYVPKNIQFESKKTSQTSQVDRQILEMMFGSIPIANQSTIKLHFLQQRQKILISKLFKFVYRPVSQPTTLQRANSDSATNRRENLSDPEDSIIVKEIKEEKARNSFFPSQQIKTNFAVGVIIDTIEKNETVQNVVLSHYSLIDYYVRIIVSAINEIIDNIQNPKDDFLELGNSFKSFSSFPKLNKITLPFFDQNSLQSDIKLIDSSKNLQNCILNLITLPRLNPPVWLNIVSNPHKRKETLDEFLTELSFIYSMLEKNPKSPFFLSRIITTVLSHHLSWLQSLSKFQSQQSNTQNETSALLTQLNSLFGCIISPTSPFCRVIVLSSNSELSKKILFIISYFIRCSEVCVYNNTITFPDLDFTHVDESLKKDSEENESNDSKEGDILDLESVPLVYDSRASMNPSNSPFKNIGRSLFGAYCRKYSNDFVLMGLNPASQDSLASLLFSSLENQYKFWQVTQGTEIHSASCIVVDLDQITCKVYTYNPKISNHDCMLSKRTIISPQSSIRTLKPSPTIVNCIELVCNFWRMSIPPDICVMYLEDCLQEIYDKSELLRSFLIDNNPQSTTYTSSEVANLLHFPSKDDAEMLGFIQYHLGRPISQLLSIS